MITREPVFLCHLSTPDSGLRKRRPCLYHEMFFANLKLPGAGAMIRIMLVGFSTQNIQHLLQGFSRPYRQTMTLEISIVSIQNKKREIGLRDGGLVSCRVISITQTLIIWIVTGKTNAFCTVALRVGERLFQLMRACCPVTYAAYVYQGELHHQHTP